MVALVIDPLKGEGGWFVWKGESIELTTTFPTPAVSSSRAVAAVEEHSRSNRRSSMLVGGAAIALLVLIAGYALGSSLAPAKKSASSTDQVEVERLQSELDRVNGELATNGEVGLFPNCSFEYSVKAGDGFWSIAQRFLGDGTKAKDLQSLNPELLTNGMDPGDTMKIPANGCEPSDELAR